MGGGERVTWLAHDREGGAELPAGAAQNRNAVVALSQLRHIHSQSHRVSARARVCVCVCVCAGHGKATMREFPAAQPAGYPLLGPLGVGGRVAIIEPSGGQFQLGELERDRFFEIFSILIIVVELLSQLT